MSKTNKTSAKGTTAQASRSKKTAPAKPRIQTVEDGAGGEAQAAPNERGKTARAAKQTQPKKLSAIDAAAQLLAGTKEPMNCKELIDAMATKGLWSSPGGKTPHATLYSAILREIQTKGVEARFQKTERGKFAASA